jgi:hypothetical protein
MTNTAIAALPYTKMPLHDWAERLGLNPIHFAGGLMSGRFVEGQACAEPWARYTWQQGYHLSHNDVAIAISTAESLIEEYLGYHVAPAWRTEPHAYPRYRNRYQTYGRNTVGRTPAIQMERSKIISVSYRKQEFIATVPVIYQDLDNDGYKEIAYVALPNGKQYPATEIALFPPGLANHPSWQIRYPKRWGETGNDRYFLIDFWLMIRPEIMAKLPGETHQPPILDNQTNLLDNVDVYRVYECTDPAPINLEWESAQSCWPLDGTSRRVGGIVRDPEAGLIAPSVTWGQLTPDRFVATYYSGSVSQDYQAGYTLNPLGGHLADAVFYLATARLTRELCACAEARALAVELRTDMSLVSPQGNFLAVADAIQVAPFGTRRGEWLAYQALKLVEKHIEVAVF